MIYEIRTYTLQVAAVPEAEKRFGEAYESRRRYSELWGFFHTEVGQLNQVIQIWPYESMAHRDEVRQEVAAKEKDWPPKLGDLMVHAETEILTPFPFVKALEPGSYGPIFEMRSYNFRFGEQGALAQSWEAALPARLERSPLALAGIVEMGEINRFIHIWPYRSMNERLEMRTQAVKDGIWPPPGGGNARYFAQENKLMLPSRFSPIQ